MPTEMIDGFPITEKIDGWIFLKVDSERLTEFIAYCQTHDDYGLAISRVHGYQLDNLDFLAQCSRVKAIYVQDAIPDISGLYHLKRLQWLLLSEPMQSINLSRFPHLEVFRGDWSPRLQWEECQSLRKLAIWKYKPKSRDLVPLSSLVNLEELEITQSPLKSLTGIENLFKLQRLELSYLSKLEDVSPLQNKSAMETLRFDHCKNIPSFETIATLNRLKTLGIDGCGKIASLQFVKALTKLEFLSFVDTEVLDGDLSPCLQLHSLKHLGFFNKRNYSYSYEDCKALLEGRHQVSSLVPSYSPSSCHLN